MAGFVALHHGLIRLAGNTKDVPAECLHFVLPDFSI
jgi:hypothetical protein